MAQGEPSAPDEEPLLSRATSPASSYSSVAKSVASLEENVDEVRFDRSLESDVLPENTPLKRNLTWSSAYILIISRVIGSGIFATPGDILKSVGSVGITLILWIAGAIISWFGLQVYLEYGCMLPRSGGDKVYLEFTYRRPRFLASVMIAVQSVLLGFTASNCIVFGEYVLFAFGKEATPGSQKLLGLTLLTTVIIIHSCFLRTGIFIQNVLGWVKIGLIVFMVLTSLFVVLFRSRERANSAPPVKTTDNYFWRGSVWEWGVITTALFKVFYSYAGLQNVNNVLNEVKNPVKTLKSAATVALVTCSILYLLINVAYFVIVPLDDIKHSGELIAALFFETIFGPKVGRTLLPLAIAISAAGNVMVVTFSHARVIQEIAKQGFLPFAGFIGSSKPFNAPMGALIVHYIPSFLVIAIPAKNVYSFILEVEGYPGQFFALATSFGVIWLRIKRPELDRPFKAFLPAIWLRIILAVALIIAPLIPGKNWTWKSHLSQISYAFVGLAILSFGVGYWFVLTVLMPKWRGYELDEAVEVLDDGTAITRLVHVSNAAVPSQ